MPTSNPKSDVPNIQSYRALAHDYDGTRYVSAEMRLVESFRHRALTSLLPARPARAIDVACGTGRGVVVLREYAQRAYGVDGTLEMLKVAQTKRDAAGDAPRLCQGNAAQLPFADGTFDVVTSLNFVHLFPVEEKKAFISEMGRIAKVGGTVIVEFDNVLQGLVLGIARKYLVKDIGYDWPSQMRYCFDPKLYRITAMHGANIPWIWKAPALHFLERATSRFPMNHLAARTFVQAVRI
jgi:ubiquinone/menaquinone biosynthesis C-methylase UbiE